MALIVRDLKPDNLRFRLDGSFAIVDTGSGSTFPVQKRTEQQASLMQRRTTTVSSLDFPQNLAPKPGSGVLRAQLARPGDKYMAVTSAAMKDFEFRLGEKGLAVVGGTTPGFRNEELLKQADNERRVQRSVRQFDMNYGFKQDTYAMFRTVLYLLTHKQDDSIQTWDILATDAATQGASGIKRLLLDAAPPGKNIEQHLALERMVDFLAGGLGSGMESDIERALTHEILTLPILTPDEEICLRSPDGIPFPPVQIPRGFLDSLPPNLRVKVQNAKVPKLSLALQGDMGPGMRADEDVDGDSFLSVYVGEKVPNLNCGDAGDVLQHPSRYKVTGQGNIKILKQINDTKFTSDAQMNTKNNFKAWKDLGNSGPFMNAAESERKANCKVDRVNAWYDKETNLIWMLTWSKPAGIKKGKHCIWHYKYLAGPGKLWQFWPYPWAGND